MKRLLVTLAAGFALAQAYGQKVGIGTTTPTDQLHTTGTVRFEGYNSSGTRLIQIDSSGRLIVSGAGPVFSNTSSQSIPDNGCGTNSAASSSIVVSSQAAPTQSSRIAVRLRLIMHPVNSELRILLIAPNGDILTLASGNGGTGTGYSNTVFSDAAAVHIGSATSPFTSKYKPAGALTPQCLITPTVSTFAAISGGAIVPNGTWTLKVYDDASGNSGILGSWDISFSGPESFLSAEQNNYLPKFSSGNLVSSKIYESPANGFLGIGNSAPAYNLDVNGTFRTTSSAVIGSTIKISGGNPGAGKVLTDTSGTGNAIWQALPARNSAFQSKLIWSYVYSGLSVVPFITNSIFNVGYDDGGTFNNATNRFVAPADGVYHFDFILYVGWNQFTINSGYIEPTFYLNGTPDVFINLRLANGDYIERVMALSRTLKLNANDYVQIKIYQNVAGVLYFENTSAFTGYRVY